jgi:hypothetical protein
MSAVINLTSRHAACASPIWGLPVQSAVDDMNAATNPLTMCVWFNESPLAMQIMSPLTCGHAIFSTGFVAHDARLI